MPHRPGAETINYEEVDDVVETLKEMIGNVGPDACIDAVGVEAHGPRFLYTADPIWGKRETATQARRSTVHSS